MIRFHPQFAPPGAIYNPQPGCLALDTGNQAVPGVIDHHQAGATHDCTATLIVQHPEWVLDHLAGWPIETVTFLLHRRPDFDACAAAYLAQALIETGALPPGAVALAAYALQVDSATLPPTAHPEQTPYALMAGIGELLDAQPAAAAGDADYQRDVRQLERGLELMDYLAQAAAAGRSLSSPDLFSGDHPFGPEQVAVHDDYARYLRDLAGGRLSTLPLPTPEGGSRRVSLLSVRDPASALFKVWARADETHASIGPGFVMTSVQRGPARYIISVDPQAGVWLRGLGAALDEAETARRAALGQPRSGPPRPGYTNSDPWYDGRSPIHHYTIVDAPRAGTVLTAAEVAAIVEHPETWPSDG